MMFIFLMRFMKIGLIILKIMLMVSVLSGCSLFAPVPAEPMTHYQLNASTTPLVKKIPRKVTLLVALPNSVGVNNTNEMAYSVKPYEVAYFAKNRWIDTPAQMLAPLIVASLEKTYYFSSIGTPASLGRYDFVLNTDLVQFEQIFFTHFSVFRFKLRAQIIAVSSSRIIASKEFFAEARAPYYSPYGGVIAANHAASSVLTQLSNWIVQQNLVLKNSGKIIIKQKTTIATEVNK